MVTTYVAHLSYRLSSDYIKPLRTSQVFRGVLKSKFSEGLVGDFYGNLRLESILETFKHESQEFFKNWNLGC